MDPLPPLFFDPIYQTYLWGGNAIPHFFKRSVPPGVYAESWEISDREEGMSRVRVGNLRGMSLRTILAEKKELLLGEESHSTRFPLLIKLIDAHQNLSVQVHPDHRSAYRFGGEAKTEAWYIIDAEKGAKLYAGFKKKEEKNALLPLLSSSAILEKMHTIPATPGDLLFIPGGTVHAIGKGCLLFEIQQNSNTTYRVYDWDRVDQQGEKRPLHIETAAKVIQWDDGSFPVQIKREIEKNQNWSRWNLLTSPYFTVEKWEIHHSLFWEKQRNKFEILFILSGEATLLSSFEEPIKSGTTILLPAQCEEVELKITRKPLTLLRSFI